MYLTLKQWEEILDAVNPDKGDILRQIKEILEKDHHRIYKRFETNDFDINAQFRLENRSVSLLHIAAGNGKSKIVQYLIGKRADVSVRDSDYNTPLHCAARYGHLEIVQALLEEKKTNINVQNKHGDTPLNWAAHNGHSEVVACLIDKGANFDVKNYDGNTLLHWLICNSHSKVVKYFIEKKEVNVDAKNKYGNTPLHLAVRNGCLEVVKALLEKNAKVDITNDYGDTPLHDAASNGYLDIVEALLEQTEVNVDVKNNYGNTPLHWAARNGHSEVVAYLIGKKAKVDITNDYGETSLHWAAFKGHKDVVTTLLEKGANPFIKNKDGKTPRDLANDENIIQLLKEAETKQIISKAIKIGATLSIITALTVGVGCGIAGVGLPILIIASIAASAALVIGLAAAGITYSVLKPSDKLDKPGLKAANQQVPERA